MESKEKDKMVGIVVIGHGRIGSELVRSLTKIVGQIEAIKGVDFLAYEGREDLFDKVEKAIKKVDKGQGVIILTDLFGGCCCNVAALLINKYRVKIISGVNLPMLLEVVFNRTQPLERLELEAVKGGVKGIIDVCETLDKIARKEQDGSARSHR